MAGPTVIHERWVLENVSEHDYIICTPDRDIYCETMDVTNPDFKSFRIRPAPGILPPGVVAGQVYGLPNWNAQELSDIRNEARTEAAAEAGRRRGGCAQVAQTGPVAPVAVPIVQSE